LIARPVAVLTPSPAKSRLSAPLKAEQAGGKHGQEPDQS
jgi:hypothetical protein